MPLRRKLPIHIGLSIRIQRLTGDVEKLLPEIMNALDSGDPAARYLVEAR